MASAALSEARFWSKVEKTDGCWLWLACVNPAGYGKVDRDQYGEQLAHRAALVLAGVAVAGRTVHHRCENPRCVRPEHLQLVERGAHMRLHATNGGTHCKRGHLFDEQNTYVRKNGTRWCLACAKMRRKR